MKQKIDFQDGGHLRFSIGTILAIFYLQVTPMLPSKFGVNWPFGSGEEAKNRFSRWLPWLPISTILAIFDLQVTPMLPSKFGVNWHFGSGEEAKNRFSRWRPSWISDRKDFSCFWSTSHLDASYQVSSQLAQGWRRSRLLKQLLTLHNGWHTTDDRHSDDRHWLTTIAYHEHFVLRWAKNIYIYIFIYICRGTPLIWVSKDFTEDQEFSGILFPNFNIIFK